MNNGSRQLQEIAELEHWLDRALTVDDRQTTEHLKLRVRVELHEQWLRGNWDGHSTESVPRQLHAAVRNAVGERPQCDMVRAEHARAGTWRWLSGVGLGLAAMLYFSVAVFRTDQVVITDSDDGIIELEEAAVGEDFDSELDEALAELEDLLASRDETEWENALEGL